jgi:hypothetical protein
VRSGGGGVAASSEDVPTESELMLHLQNSFPLLPQ